jgi:ribosomal protein S3AE
MPRKETPEMLLRKHLGQKAATALLGKIDKMIAKRASAAQIEKMVSDEIAATIEKQVINALSIKIGPLEPIKIKPIQVAIKPAIKPTPVIKINTGVSVKAGSVKIGPPTYVKGIR